MLREWLDDSAEIELNLDTYQVKINSGSQEGLTPDVSIGISDKSKFDYSLHSANIHIGGSESFEMQFDTGTENLTVKDSSFGQMDAHTVSVRRIQTNGMTREFEATDMFDGSNAGVVFDFSQWNDDQEPIKQIIEKSNFTLFLPLVNR